MENNNNNMGNTKTNLKVLCIFILTIICFIIGIIFTITGIILLVIYNSCSCSKEPCCIYEYKYSLIGTPLTAVGVFFALAGCLLIIVYWVLTRLNDIKNVEGRIYTELDDIQLSTNKTTIQNDKDLKE